jgi:hypothetical protein
MLLIFRRISLFEFRKFQRQTALRCGAKESRGAPIQKAVFSAKKQYKGRPP